MIQTIKQLTTLCHTVTVFLLYCTTGCLPEVLWRTQQSQITRAAAPTDFALLCCAMCLLPAVYIDEATATATVHVYQQLTLVYRIVLRFTLHLAVLQAGVPSVLW